MTEPQKPASRLSDINCNPALGFAFYDGTAATAMNVDLGVSIGIADVSDYILSNYRSYYALQIPVNATVTVAINDKGTILAGGVSSGIRMLFLDKMAMIEMLGTAMYGKNEHSERGLLWGPSLNLGVMSNRVGITTSVKMLNNDYSFTYAGVYVNALKLLGMMRNY